MSRFPAFGPNVMESSSFVASGFHRQSVFAQNRWHSHGSIIWALLFYSGQETVINRKTSGRRKRVFFFFLFSGTFLFFRERGAGPGASRAYGRDGRTDAGPKMSLFFEIQSLISYPKFSYFKLRPSRRTTRDGRTPPDHPGRTDGQKIALKNLIFCSFCQVTL